MFPNINNDEPSCTYTWNVGVSRAEWFKIGSDRFVSFRRSDETPWNSMISPMALCSSNNCDTPGNQPQDKLILALDTSRYIFIRVCPAIVVHETLVKFEKHWWTLIQISSIRIFELNAKLLFRKSYSTSNKLQTTSNKIVKNIKIIMLFNIILKTYLR